MSVGGLCIPVVGALILEPADPGLTSPALYPLIGGSNSVNENVLWSQFGTQSLILPLARSVMGNHIISFSFSFIIYEMWLIISTLQVMSCSCETL